MLVHAQQIVEGFLLGLAGGEEAAAAAQEKGDVESHGAAVCCTISFSLAWCFDTCFDPATANRTHFDFGGLSVDFQP